MTALAPVDTPIDDDDLAASLAAYVDRDVLADDPDDSTDSTNSTEPPLSDSPAADQPTDDDAAMGDGTTPLPDPAAADQPPAVDPWAALAKDAAPMAYKQDGLAKTFNGILEVPGKGALIPADQLDAVRNMIARHEGNAAATKDLYAFRQSIEGMGGVAKFHELSEQNAQLNAASVLILDALTRDPTQFVMVENGQIVANPATMSWLLKNAGLATKEALWTARQDRDTREQTRTTEAGESEVRQHAVPDSIDALASQYGLSPDDVAEAKAIFGPVADALLYKATPDDQRQYGFAPGTLLVNRDKMRPWLEARQTQNARQSAEAKARQAAAKVNASRVPVKPAAPARPARPKDPTTGQFVERKYFSKDEMMNRALAGKSNDPDDGDD